MGESAHIGWFMVPPLENTDSASDVTPVVESNTAGNLFCLQLSFGTERNFTWAVVKKTNALIFDTKYLIFI